ncbi:MAG: aspartyl protease family protein [Nitrospirae bacterium]|nr:aspartyl protease family protein [Candidatus Troglogloeales bacterium]MBI3597868.1 aspartyl protease family protein [Candidatus Troglogloeales bacterium]
MGTFKIPVTILNPSDATRSWTGDFLVDTGAIDTLVPTSRLEAMGIHVRMLKKYRMADGSTVELKTGTIEVAIENHIVGVTAMFGDENATPLLGATAMESLGIVVDSSNKKIGWLNAIDLA